MKKKIVAATLCVCMGLSMFGCGKKSSEEETTTATTQTVYTQDDLVDDTQGELNVLDYVELAEYKGIEATKTITNVSDEDVTTQMNTQAIELTAEGVVIADGDTAVIDFVGKKDGVAFEGGTGSDYPLVIGSGSFIDGFEDGLIGVANGATVDLNLTFPENYQATDLAGKDVVFTVTVKSVKRKPAELTDDWFAGNTAYTSVAQYQEEVRSQLETAAEEEAQATLENTVLDQVVNGSKVKKYFKSYVEEGETQYENYVKQYASLYSMTLSEFIEKQNMTEADYNTQKANQGINYAKAAMIVEAIAGDAGLSKEDEGYKAVLEELAKTYNMDGETLLSTYGEDLVGISVLTEYVMGYVADNATVTVKNVDEVSETTTAATE